MFDIEGARKAGYNDREIAEHLARRHKFDLRGAQLAGYRMPEIIQHLMQRETPIPGAEGEAARREAAQAAPRPSVGQRVAGAAETALQLATGATGGAIGMIGGTAEGLARAIATGTIGTQEGAQQVEQTAAQRAGQLTYEPRTEQGQRNAETLEAVGQALTPLVGMAPQIASVAQSAQAAAPVAVTAGRLAGASVREAAQAVPQQIAREVMATINANRDMPSPAAAPGRGSVGAAGADIARQRVELARSMPEPIQLTRGQATRDQTQMRFEAEQAKLPEGGPLRERFAEQNRAIAANLEHFIDETGATATSPLQAGRIVDSALVRAAAQEKTKYRVLYQEAAKAGQMAEPVSTAPLVQFLKSNAEYNTAQLSGATLGLLENLLVKYGGAKKTRRGLVPAEMTLEQTELLRRQMNRAIGASTNNQTNMATAIEVKRIIDGMTEGRGGAKYQQARRARQRYAQLFEDNEVVNRLLTTRRGTKDRNVALEDVFERSILRGSRQDLSWLRRTIQIAGKDTDGPQAWKELQGETVRYILNKATENSATDSAGNVILSPAKLNRAIRDLDQDGKLEFVLGKQGAQRIRDINELAKVSMTAPPGTVNTSNTAGVLITALAEAGALGGTLGIPLPVVSGLRQLAKNSKDRALRKRIEDALNPPEFAE